MRSHRIAVTTTIVVLLALAATSMYGRAQPAARAGSIVVRTVELPDVQVMAVGDLVIRVDSRTGAVATLQGNPTNRAVPNSWKERVPGVTEPNSGLLQLRPLQYAGTELFMLVDLRDGTTWRLASLGNFIGAWELVEIEP